MPSRLSERMARVILVTLLAGGISPCSSPPVESSHVPDFQERKLEVLELIWKSYSYRHNRQSVSCNMTVWAAHCLELMISGRRI